MAGIVYLTDTRVTAVDAAAKTLTTADGDDISYSKLLVATGARVGGRGEGPHPCAHRLLVSVCVRMGVGARIGRA